jgi:hypothetical protein
MCLWLVFYSILSLMMHGTMNVKFVQILFIHVYCTAVQSSVRKYDNICVTSLMCIFEAVGSTQHIYFILHYLSYLKTLFTPQNILQDTSEMCAKTQIKCTLFWCHFN